MFIKVCLSVAVLMVVPAWSQVAPSATGGGPSSDADTRMLQPPPVSGDAYPTTFGSEGRSNYVTAGMRLDTAYVDNVLPGSTSKPVSDVTYSIGPSIALNQTTPRQMRSLTYSPGFTFYQPTSQLDAIDQNGKLDYQFRLRPYTTMSIRDSFAETSSVFNQANPLSEGGVSGSLQPSTATVVAPFAKQITNTVTAGISHQVSQDAMIGVGGVFELLHYLNPSQAQGLSNSTSSGGSAFFNRRLGSMQYVGVAYQFAHILASPQNTQSETLTNTILPFYTIYLNSSTSLSLSCGLEHLNASETLLPTYSSWSPIAMASFGWHASRANFATSYSRAIVAGGGILGAYNANTANTSFGWQIAHSWTTGLGAAYSNLKNATPLLSQGVPGGYTVSGSASIQHPIGEHLVVNFGYERLHQSFSGIQVISQEPDTDREFISLSYQLKRPLGR
jgi:hypothetical protein